MSQYSFINPPPFGTVGDYDDSPSYVIDTTVNVTWASSTSNLSLWLLKDGGDLFCPELNLALTFCQLLNDGLNSEFYTWDIIAPVNYTAQNPIYYLSLRTDALAGLAATHYLYILPFVGQASTATAVTTSSITSATSATSSIEGSVTATTTASPTTSSTAGGLTSGSKLAIGLGVGLGVPLILILGAIAFLLHRHGRRKQNRDGLRATNATHSHPPEYTAATESKFTPQPAMGTHQGAPQEVAGNQSYPTMEPAELPIGQYSR